jgi:glycosyltransferase involved in cell wall biosynthesis
MSKSCKISVVMPCFNHGEFLPEAVASVTNIKRDDIELIVVDDGSTDERTGREMDRLCAQGIKVIRQENKGLAAARNAGVLASKGEYIFPLDADDRMRAGWIDRGIEILDAMPRVGVVYGDTQFFGIRTDVWEAGPFDADRLLDSNVIPCSGLYRRVVWEQTGGYDGTMPVQGYEDWDLWLGAFELGWQFAHIPEVFFEYRQAQGSMIKRAAAFEEQVREFVAKKHGPLYRERWVQLRALQHELEAKGMTLEKILSSRYWKLWTLYREVRFRVKHPIAQALRRFGRAKGPSLSGKTNQIKAE